MNELVLTNNDLPITSVKSLVEIRKTSPRYKDEEPAARQKWLKEKLIYCNAINHQKPDARMLQIDVAALDEGMMHDQHIADLTATEITFAMFHGVLGEYGEYYGLTPKTFMGFFREYLKTDLKYWATEEEKKIPIGPDGSWILERIEHHRQQVQKEWEERDTQEELDSVLGLNRKQVIETIKQSNTLKK